MNPSLRAQYLQLKQQFPDALLLFRHGDVYELYDEDAHVAARELGLTLATRLFDGGERVPLCPLPCHAVERHIQRLVARGYKVAIAEQIGDPCTSQGRIERAVVRVVTPTAAIRIQHHPPSSQLGGPSDAEPDSCGRPVSRRGRIVPVPSTSADRGVAVPASGSDGGREEGSTVPAVQLALFAWPAGGDDRGR